MSILPSDTNLAKTAVVKAGYHLLGDIGATNARFALMENGAIGEVASFDVAAYEAFADAARAFLTGVGNKASIDAALLAVAGPIEAARCTLTNCSWEIDAEKLAKMFKSSFRIVNDFEAVAYSLPSLGSEHLNKVGSGEGKSSAPMVALGPGSGLGVACLTFSQNKPLVLPSEGGHGTIAATSDREDAIIQCLWDRFGHVSAERVVSGPGLENIYEVIATIDKLTFPSRTAAEITGCALARTCRTASEALSIFCSLLGSFAGNMALTFGARGGVYIAGGIVPRIATFLARSEFRNRFEAKGRFRRYLEEIPTFIIVHPYAAFVGLKSLSNL